MNLTQLTFPKIGSFIFTLCRIHKFNWQTNIFFFPTRGAIHYGEIEHVDYRQLNHGGVYNINSIFW